MQPDAEIRGMSIVLLGDFNPKIFQPAWFGGHGLIRPTEADEAEVEIVHSEVTKFRLDWVVLQVTRDRLEAAGIMSANDLVRVSLNTLLNVPGIGETTAEKLRETAQEMVNAKVSAYREEQALLQAEAAKSTEDTSENDA